MDIAQLLEHEPSSRIVPLQDEREIGEEKVKMVMTVDMYLFMSDDKSDVGIKVGFRYHDSSPDAERCDARVGGHINHCAVDTMLTGVSEDVAYTCQRVNDIGAEQYRACDIQDDECRHYIRSVGDGRGVDYCDMQFADCDIGSVGCM